MLIKGSGVPVGNSRDSFLLSFSQIKINNAQTQIIGDFLEEINYLESVKRPEISRQIAEARDKGDLSENAEYDAAKEAQGLLEMKISQLKDKVANARIIDDSKLNTHTVQILNRVKIRNTKNNMTMEYTIVTESEANLKEGKIASSTPIAQGLLGKKIGDIVEIKVPSGIMTFEIVNISI